jgi:hypothetical protein
MLCNPRDLWREISAGGPNRATAAADEREGRTEEGNRTDIADDKDRISTTRSVEHNLSR